MALADHSRRRRHRYHRTHYQFYLMTSQSADCMNHTVHICPSPIFLLLLLLHHVAFAVQDGPERQGTVQQSFLAPSIHRPQSETVPTLHHSLSASLSIASSVMITPARKPTILHSFLLLDFQLLPSRIRYISGSELSVEYFLLRHMRQSEGMITRGPDGRLLARFACRRRRMPQ